MYPDLPFLSIRQELKQFVIHFQRFLEGSQGYLLFGFRVDQVEYQGGFSRIFFAVLVQEFDPFGLQASRVGDDSQLAGQGFFDRLAQHHLLKLEFVFGAVVSLFQKAQDQDDGPCLKQGGKAQVVFTEQRKIQFPGIILDHEVPVFVPVFGNAVLGIRDQRQ